MQPSAAAATDPPPLLALPIEVLLSIADFLPPTALLALHLTSRALYNATSIPKFTDRGITTARSHYTRSCGPSTSTTLTQHNYEWLAIPAAHEEARDVLPSRPSYLELLGLEHWAIFRGLWACEHCTRLIRRDRFTVAQTRGNKAKGALGRAMDAYAAQLPRLDYPSAGQSSQNKHIRRGSRRLAADSLPVKVKGDEARWSRGTPQIPSRCCIACGVKSGMYQPGGQMLTFALESSEDEDVEGDNDGDNHSADRGEGQSTAHKQRGRTRTGTGMVCMRCRKFTVCEIDSTAALNRRCDACLEYRPRWRK